MTIRFSALFAPLVFLLTCRPAGAAADARPNILFILCDDLRWDMLSCTNPDRPPPIQTPNIDRIGREGAIFRNAFVTDPLCFPSRAAILTGQYNHKNGVRVGQDRAPLGHRLVTFPLLLHRAGYDTALIGKWHLANDQIPAPGIDRWVVLHEQGDYIDPLLYIDGKAVKTKGYVTDLLTDYALDFIRRPRDHPWVVYLGQKAPHAPFTPPKRYQGIFNNRPILPPPGAFDTWDGKPVLKRPGIKLHPKTDSDVETSHFTIRDYMGCVLGLDDSMKRIWEALRASGQLDRTIIVFTSDNGYFFGEHDLGGKHGPYEESVRVPLLIRYPKAVPAGSVFDQFVLNIDFAPTFLDFAGVPVPQDMDGRSLRPLLAGDTAGWRTSFLTEFFLGNGTNRFPTWQAIRDERWKYIRYAGYPQFDELYDLSKDPYELKNLAHAPQVREARHRMATLLTETAPPVASSSGK